MHRDNTPPARHHSFQREALPHRDSLYSVALRLTRNRSDAEDLVQETWLRALGAWDQFVLGSNCRAWLLRILTNSFINGYRRRKRHRRLEGGSRQDAIRALYGTDDDNNQPSQARRIDATLGDEVSAALTEIGDDYRLVVEMADLDGRRYRDIADELDVPIGTVMSRLFRARRKLEDSLRAYAANDYGIVRAA